MLCPLWSVREWQIPLRFYNYLSLCITLKADKICLKTESTYCRMWVVLDRRKSHNFIMWRLLLTFFCTFNFFALKGKIGIIGSLSPRHTTCDWSDLKLFLWALCRIFNFTIIKKSPWTLVSGLIKLKIKLDLWSKFNFVY